MTEVRAACREFFGFLRKRYPIPDDVKVTLRLEDTDRVKFLGGERVLATFRGRLDTRTAHVKVALRGGDLTNVLQSVGHEYKHIIQTFIENRFPKGLVDLPYEMAAEGFAIRTVGEFRKSRAA